MRTIGQPGRDKAADVPCGVVDRGIDRAMLRVNQLGNQEGGCTVGDCDPEANEETGADEHRKRQANGLNQDP